jgi:cytochrome P450 family 49 subfamily A
MRPSSASYYLDDLIDVTQDFLNLVITNADSDSVIDDLTPYMYRFAMEAVTVVFLDSRLGCLNDPPNPQAQILMDNLNIVIGDTLVELLFGLPFWKIIPTKSYKNYDEASEIVHKISTDLIKVGQKKHLEQVVIPKVFVF